MTRTSLIAAALLLAACAAPDTGPVRQALGQCGYSVEFPRAPVDDQASVVDRPPRSTVMALKDRHPRASYEAGCICAAGLRPPASAEEAEKTAASSYESMGRKIVSFRHQGSVSSIVATESVPAGIATTRSVIIYNHGCIASAGFVHLDETERPRGETFMKSLAQQR